MYRIYTYLIILCIVCSTMFFTDEDIKPALAHSGGNGSSSQCNYLPNSSFEHDITNNWAFVNYNGGNNNMSHNINGDIQSGSRSVQFNIYNPGVYFTTTPERDGINSGSYHNFRFSIRFKAGQGQEFKLGIAEWKADKNLASYWESSSFISNPTSSIDGWQDAENIFRTGPYTQYISIRLVFNTTPGVFTFDDAMLEDKGIGGARCVDARHYFSSTSPNYRLCMETAAINCINGHKDYGGKNEYAVTYRKPVVPNQSMGEMHDYYVNVGSSTDKIAILKFYLETPPGAWHCYTNNSISCSNTTGNAVRGTQLIPVMSILTPLDWVGVYNNPAARTNSATETMPWGASWNSKYDPTTGLLTANTGASLTNRTSMFLLKSYNFGGQIGLRTNVLVVEEEQLGTLKEQAPGGQVVYTPVIRLERYFYVRGLGRVAQQGFIDKTCNTGDLSGCGDTYAPEHPLVIWNIRVTGEIYAPVTSTLFNADWW